MGQRLVAGAYIRIIIVDPTVEPVLEEFVLRNVGDTTPEYWRNRLQTVERALVKRCVNSVQAALLPGPVFIALLPSTYFTPA